MSRLDDIDARLKARLDSANASLRGAVPGGSTPPRETPVPPGIPAAISCASASFSSALSRHCMVCLIFFFSIFSCGCRLC